VFYDFVFVGFDLTVCCFVFAHFYLCREALFTLFPSQPRRKVVLSCLCFCRPRFVVYSIRVISLVVFFQATYAEVRFVFLR